MRELLKKDFYFDLPPELIAQDPLEDRSGSRLLVLDKETGEIEHRVFTDIVEYLREGDCLVLNNTKVIPARLMGEKAGTGAAIEVLLLKRRENDVWEALVKPGKKAREGAVISFGGGLLTGEVIDVVEEGNRLIQFRYEGIFEEVLDRLGEMPLPPYITHKLADRDRYRTWNVPPCQGGKSPRPPYALRVLSGDEGGGRSHKQHKAGGRQGDLCGDDELPHHRERCRCGRERCRRER